MTTEAQIDEPIALTDEEIALAEAPIGGSPFDDTNTGNADAEAVDESNDGDGEGESDDASGGTDAAAERQADDDQEEVEGDGEQGGSPFSDEEVQRAKSLGLEDEDIAGFSTPRALKLYLDLTEKVNAVSGEPGGFKPPEGQASEQQPDQGGQSNELLDLSLYDGTHKDFADDAFDDRSLAVAKAVRREQELRLETQRELAGLRDFVSQLQQERIITQFSDQVDALGVPELGEARDSRGRFAELTTEQVERRSKLFAEVEKVAAEQQAKGQTGLTWEQTIAEAGKRLGIKPRKDGEASKTDALKRQSAMRRPVSKSSASTKSQRDQAEPGSVEAIANDPEIVALWNESVGR
jgi:hypothetical protein